MTSKSHSPTGTHRAASLSWAIFVTSLGFVVVQLDVSIVNVALPAISSALHTGVGGMQWVVDMYTLAFAACLLSAGAIGDRIGARRGFVIGTAVFTLASMGCGFAPNLASLIAARAVQGIGAALLMPCSLALLNHACRDDAPARAKAVGLWTAAGGVALSAGPVIGGLLLHPFGWRSIFLVNLPIGVLAIWLALRRTEETDTQEKQQFDIAGLLLAVIALLAGTAAVIESGSRGWQSPVVWIGLAISVIGLVVFVVVESRQRAPMLPLKFFSDLSFNVATGVGLVVNFALYGTIFVLSLYFQHVRHESPIDAGLAFLPFMLAIIVANVVGGRLAASFGPRWPMTAGLAIGTIGFACLGHVGAQTGFVDLNWRLVLVSLGIGLAAPPMTAALLSRVPRAQSGVASGVLNTVRQAAGAIGVAVFGTLAASDIVGGMRAAFVTSAVLLLLIACLAAVGMRQAKTPRHS
ncbi:MFS transporter [Rhodanobacter sp. L36]|uniref:MFS transporter n=1 Tax=Rhodanobacter sp. L36 TaxID=1747221 RepID=UPI00131E39F6|nr:MFS transporter [Rhodanobacter sp. L36]